MAKNQNKKQETKVEVKHASAKALAFGKKNYRLMLIGLGLLVIGFILMYGPADGDIFEFRRITLAPLVVLAGFVVEVYAIFAKSKD